MPRSVDSSRGTGGSILSVLTTSSRASEAYQTEAEKSASRVTRRTVSDSGHRSDHEYGRNTPQPNRDQVKRKREFRGRHIQMFGIGTSQNCLCKSNNTRRNYRSGCSAWIWKELVFCRTCINITCLSCGCHGGVFRLGIIILVVFSNDTRSPWGR